jgi:hypothetical protein
MSDAEPSGESKPNRGDLSRALVIILADHLGFGSANCQGAYSKHIRTLTAKQFEANPIPICDFR